MKNQSVKQSHTKKDSKSKEVEEYTKNKSIALIVLSCIGMLFAIAALATIGNGNSKGIGIMTIIVGIVVALLVLPGFLKKKTAKTITYIAIAAFMVLSSIVAMIADPIAVNNQCSKFTTVEEYDKAPLSETIHCWNKREELEEKARIEKEEQRAKKKAEKEQKEQELQPLKDECSAKKHNWNYSEERCYTDEEQSQYEQKLSEQKAKQEAEKKAEDEKETQESTTPPASTATKPSIDTIADACWSYGQKMGVHLTDYASDEIVQDGNYYQILMWNKDKSVWKCWYNPSDGDVFIEKTKDSRR